MVYIDPKVQLLFPKQNVTKYPKSYKKSQTDSTSAISKQLNALSNMLPLPWQLGNRQTMGITTCGKAMLLQANLDDLFIPHQNSDVYASLKYLCHTDKIAPYSFGHPFS